MVHLAGRRSVRKVPAVTLCLSCEMWVDHAPTLHRRPTLLSSPCRLRLSCGHTQALVRGDAVLDKRAAITSKGDVPLSEEEQAACLLDMATDANILGRAYRGWRPWL